MFRRHVNKIKSARSFKRNVRRTKAANMKGLSRGGWRL